MGDLPAVVLANAAAAAVLFAAAGLVCAVARSPAVAHKAWLLVLVKLVTPPLVVLPVVWSAAEVTPNPGPTGPSPPVPEEVPLDPEPDGEANRREATPDEPRGLPPWEGVPEAVTPAVPSAEEPAAAEPPAPLPWRSALAAVWLGGTAAYWLLVAVRVVRFRRMLRSAVPAPSEVVALVRQTADRLGLRNPPTAGFVGAAVSPMVWAGLGRPRLILPRPLWESLTPDQREAVLAHELAHLRRGDHWVRRLELVVLGLYWWFPVAWLAGRRLRDAEEACCDAWVVWALPGRAVAYAEALVETVAFVSRPGWVPLASGGAARADALKRRLVMILSKNPTRTGRRAVAVGLLAATLLVLPLRPGLADEVVTPVADPPAGGAGDVVAFEFPDDPRPRPQVEPNSPSRPYPNRPAPSGEVNALRDEFELLEAAGHTKAAQVRAAEVAVRAATRQLELVRRGGGGNAVAAAELATVQSELEKAEAQLDVRKAEYGEHAVKVKQAKRRLDGAQAPRPAADPTLREKKRLGDPTDADAQKLRAAEWLRKTGDKESLKTAESMRQLQEDLAKTKAIFDELTAKRKELDDQLKMLSQQQGALMSQMEKLGANLQDLRKKYPDADGPRKP